MRRVRELMAGVIAVAALASAAACGPGDTGEADGASSSPSAATPTDAATAGVDGESTADEAEAQALVAALLVNEDLSESWGPAHEAGVIPDEALPFTSGVPVECENASEDLRQPVWQVQTMFVATDEAAAEIQGSEGIVLSQRIYAGTEDDATRMFAALRTALDTCSGQLTEDSPDDPGWVQQVAVDDLVDTGDEALLLWLGNAGVDPEAGDASVTTGRVAVTRVDGRLAYVAVVESVHVAEFTGDWPEPAIPDAEFEAIVATAVGKLG